MEAALQGKGEQRKGDREPEVGRKTEEVRK